MQLGNARISSQRQVQSRYSFTELQDCPIDSPIVRVCICVTQCCRSAAALQPRGSLRSLPPSTSSSRPVAMSLAAERQPAAAGIAIAATLVLRQPLALHSLQRPDLEATIVAAAVDLASTGLGIFVACSARMMVTAVAAIIFSRIASLLQQSLSEVFHASPSCPHLRRARP